MVVDEWLGEGGWLVDIHIRRDDIFQRDEAGDDTGAFTRNPWVRRVDDRNEPTLRSGCRATRSAHAGSLGPPEGNKEFGVTRSSPLSAPRL
jgi:hypothetical protein